MRDVLNIPPHIWGMFLVAFVLAVSGDVFGNILQGQAPFGWASSCFPTLSLFLWGAAVFVGFLVASCTVYLRRNDFFIQRVQEVDMEKFSARRGLMLFVSISNMAFQKRDTSDSLESFDDFAKRALADNNGGPILKMESLESDSSALETSGKFWNWHQILRAIKRHAEALDVLYLIGSADQVDGKTGKITKGSHSQLEMLSDLLGRYFKKDPVFSGREIFVIRHNKEGVDFENVDALRHAARIGIEKFLEKGLVNRDIAIDITGGQKATSIAGAAITLENDDIVFQYVQTSSPFDVKFYDFRIRSSGS